MRYYVVAGIDEEAVDRNIAGESVDVRTYIGYKAASCPDGSRSYPCPTISTYTISSTVDLGIPDDTDTQSVTNAVTVAQKGTLNDISVSVDIRHTYKSDLKVILTSPGGTQFSLHDRSGGGANNIIKTYTTADANLKSLIGTQISGEWTLSVGDYGGGDRGTLETWGMVIKYIPAKPAPEPTTTVSPTAFSDDFESGMGKWIETGEGDWRIDTSSRHYVTTAPGKSSSNKVLHVDNCDTKCTITLKDPIDLTPYSSASLSFLRFVDTSFETGEYLKVELYNGNRWASVYYWIGGGGGNDGRWHSESYDLEDYLGVDDFNVRFVAKMSLYNEDAQIDDVLVSGSTEPKPEPEPVPPPAPAPVPVTADGCTHPPNSYSQSSYSLYVANTDDNEIRVYSPTGTYLGLMVPGNKDLNAPWDVAFGSDGHMYVANYGNGKMAKYNGITGTVIDASWAETDFAPVSLTWKDNILYVGTGGGLERFNLSGTNLGEFGDANEDPDNSSALPLYSAFDVLFAHGHMYVSDKAIGKIKYYNPTTGVYVGTISGTASSPPNTYRAHGLECQSPPSGDQLLYQSGADAGRVNKINAASGALVTAITSSMDEPMGMDADGSGNIFVANHDDHNILKIADTTVTILVSRGGLDNPSGVTVGPSYTRTAEAATESDDLPGSADPNDEPELVVLYGGTEIFGTIQPTSSPVELDVRVTDSEDDPITIGILIGGLPESAISMTDHGNGTAAVIVDYDEVASGTYVFWIEVSDSDNHAREPYVIVIP